MKMQRVKLGGSNNPKPTGGEGGGKGRSLHNRPAKASRWRVCPDSTVNGVQRKECESHAERNETMHAARLRLSYLQPVRMATVDKAREVTDHRRISA